MTVDRNCLCAAADNNKRRTKVTNSDQQYSLHFPINFCPWRLSVPQIYVIEWLRLYCMYSDNDIDMAIDTTF